MCYYENNNNHCFIPDNDTPDDVDYDDANYKLDAWLLNGISTCLVVSCLSVSFD